MVPRRNGALKRKGSCHQNRVEGLIGPVRSRAASAGETKLGLTTRLAMATVFWRSNCVIFQKLT